MQDNIVYVGYKESRVYVSSVQIQSEMGDHIRIKARGTFMNKAVDVSQIFLYRFIKEWELGKVEIGTENRPVTPREGQPEPEPGEIQRVSWIEINLIKVNQENGNQEPKV